MPLHLRQRLKTHFGREQRHRQQIPPIPYNTTNETPEQGTKQPKVDEGPLTLCPPAPAPAPVDAVLLSESHVVTNESRPSRVETELDKGIESVSDIDEAEKETSESRTPQVAQNDTPTSEPAAADQSTDDKSPIWSRSMKQFAEKEPELYQLMKDHIVDFGHHSIDSWDTWGNGQEGSGAAWFRRCKAYLPSFKAVKTAAMMISNLDPHKIAPWVTSGVFVAVELCFESVDPLTHDKAMNTMLKVNGLINKWTDGEIDIQGLKQRFSKPDENLERIDQIEVKLEVLYLDCLKLITAIYKSGKTRHGRATSTLISEPTEWDRAYQKLNDQNSECSESKSLVELAVKRNDAAVAILDQIRIRNEDPEPAHQSVKERTGIDTPESIAGNWFLEIDEFSSWLDGIRHHETGERLFWLKGSMGTGKTTLICRVISHFEEQPIGGIRFVPYYCYASETSKESKAPKHETIIRALCRRLAWNSDGSVAKPARDLIETKRGIDTSFTVKSTWEPLLKDLIACSKATIIFTIDALDECQNMEHYNLFLETLRGLPKTPKGPYYLISSRPHVPITKYFDNFVNFDATNQKAEQDMEKFIASQIDSNNKGLLTGSIFFKESTLRRRLEQALYESAGGMFRWIEIWLGVFFPKNKRPIRQKEYAENLLRNLEELETLDVLETLRDGDSIDSADIWKNHLHKAYRKLWEINGEDQYKSFQSSVFKIVTGAFESLTPQQLLEAVCLDLADSERSVILEPDELESLYYNFLKVDSKGRLNFEHLSAKLFVSEMKNHDSDELMFSERECQNVLADIGIKALEQPDHLIWRGSAIDLLDWGACAKTTLMVTRCLKPDTRNAADWECLTWPWICNHSNGRSSLISHKIRIIHNDNSVNKWTNIRKTAASAHLARYLFGHWILHCNKRRDDNQFVQRMIELCHSSWPCLKGWIFGAASIESRLRYFGHNIQEHQRQLSMRASGALHLLDDQNGTVVCASPFLFMMVLNFSPFTQNSGSKLALPSCFNDHDITLPNLFTQTPLHTACALGNNAMVTNILENQLAQKTSCVHLMDAMDDYGRIPMHHAFTDDVVKTLLKYEMNDKPAQTAPDIPLTTRLLSNEDKLGHTPVMYLMGTCSDDYLEEMLEKYRIRTSHSLNDVLMRAIEHKKIKAVAVILKNGANVNYRGSNCQTPLSLAAQVGSVPLLEMLLHREAKLDDVIPYYGSALTHAVQYRRTEAVQYLVDQGARLGTSTGYQVTAIELAAGIYHAEIVRILLEAGADITNALMKAAFCGDVDMVKFLLENGADINAQGEKYGNALVAAACSFDVEMIEFLLGQGADINAQGGKYGNALMAAAYYSDVKIINILLEKGVEYINARGGIYGTALGEVLNYPRSWEPFMVEFLLSRGADIGFLSEDDKAKARVHLEEVSTN
ncbi:hypothetical protein GGS24DRAFT_502493 [Hypoxylon argillaceum]|nr:hypothetical protein GGS24DRAFT_502493 [Hypoxylon argillaceum]